MAQNLTSQIEIRSYDYPDTFTKTLNAMWRKSRAASTEAIRLAEAVPDPTRLQPCARIGLRSGHLFYFGCYFACAFSCEASPVGL